MYCKLLIIKNCIFSRHSSTPHPSYCPQDSNETSYMNSVLLNGFFVFCFFHYLSVYACVGGLNYWLFVSFWSHVNNTTLIWFDSQIIEINIFSTLKVVRQCSLQVGVPHHIHFVLALDLEGVHDVRLHHPSSSVATSNQWCWSGVRGNIKNCSLL